jgi:hypothetical protein
MDLPEFQLAARRRGERARGTHDFRDERLTDTSVILESSRREALFVAGVWVTACLYTLGVCGLLGYRTHPAAPPALVMGIPEWAFWGVMVPWTVVLALTVWFALRVMRDVDLGEEREASDG